MCSRYKLTLKDIGSFPCWAIPIYKSVIRLSKHPSHFATGYKRSVFKSAGNKLFYIHMVLFFLNLHPKMHQASKHSFMYVQNAGGTLDPEKCSFLSEETQFYRANYPACSMLGRQALSRRAG